MSLIVQKFGGTSVADTEKILAAARKAIRAQQEGQQVVMVVSAMGKNTDMLIDLATQISDRPSAREMDMLLSTGEQVSVALMAMAIHSLGAKGVSLTGAQIGINTDATHRKARIRSISTERVTQLLDEGNIVIAAGFQGIDENLNITTLGRGGSDTTAVALAAVLGADACEIYTDVDGVYTTDPRVLPEARRVDHISYDEMLELASLGAGVMHSRSIEFAKKFSVPIHVRNSFSDVPGSVIGAVPESDNVPVAGATLTKNEALVTITDVPDKPGTSYEVFSRVAARNITIDMIVQNVGHDGMANISFTVPRPELDATMEAVHEVAKFLGPLQVASDANVSKVSVVGLGMANQTGVAARMFQSLADAGINMKMITTSEIKISALVARDVALESLRNVHQAFQLHRAPEHLLLAEGAPQKLPGRDVADVVERLRGVDMEDLFIDGITLDRDQARVTVDGVPDEPGAAAALFGEIAEAGVLVDMIVQSDSTNGAASLSFTIPRPHLDKTLQVTQSVAARLHCGIVSGSPQIAKLTVSGIGLRSHTGVAVKMFEALVRRNINVEMISTSEVSVNLVVAPSEGHQGLASLRAAFATE